MGEKPLGTDEAPAQLGTIMGASPPDVVDVPPPGMTAGSIVTTRSNIKSSGSAASDPIPGVDVKLGKNPGGGASAGGPDGGLDETSDEDDLDPMAGAAGINTTRSNIKNSGS